MKKLLNKIETSDVFLITALILYVTFITTLLYNNL